MLPRKLYAIAVAANAFMALAAPTLAEPSPGPSSSATIAPALASPSASATIAPAPSSSPSGVMFDQIDRKLVGNATPPPPGTFAADLALIQQRDALASHPNPSKPGLSLGNELATIALSYIPFVGNMIAHKLFAHNQQSSQTQALMNAGTLTRYAFLNDWSRVELPGQYAVIKRPDLGKTFVLDLKNKTYSTETTPAASGSQQPYASGSATLDSTVTWSSNQTLDIEGITTTRYDADGALKLSDAAGSCANGTLQAMLTEYVTDGTEPATLSQIAIEPLVLPQGCDPAIVRHVAGDDPHGRFYLYRVVRTQGKNAHGVVSQRANVKGLGPADAALFAPPPDFT
ncbi:MAG TPA: hypothetical protein VFF60_06765, partial [Candidatus Binatus sp.]|nr:hypothetical protein [Candidatus Binatus sp.]